MMILLRALLFAYNTDTCATYSSLLRFRSFGVAFRVKSQGGRSKHRHRPLYSHDSLTPVPAMSSSRDENHQHQQQQKNVVGVQSSTAHPAAQGEPTPAAATSSTAATQRPRGHQRNSVHFDAKVTVVRTSSPPNTTSLGGDSPVLPPPPPPPPPPPLLDEPTRKGRQPGSPATDQDGVATGRSLREVWPMAPPPPASSQPGAMLPPPPEFEGSGAAAAKQAPVGGDAATSAPSTTTGGALPRRNSMLAAMTTDLLGADDASLLAGDDYTHIYETPKYLRREKAATLRLGGAGGGGGRARSAIQYGVLANLDPGAGSPQDGATRQLHHHHPHIQQQQVRRQHPQEMPQYARTMPRGIQSSLARRSDGSGLTS